MLQAIRDKATGLVAMLIIGLIIVVFALWGIESWLGEPPIPTVANVNGTLITQQNFNNEFQHSRLQRYTLKYGAPNVKKTRELKKQFLDEKVNNIIRFQAATENGYYYSMSQIETDLRRSPGYSRDLYANYLSQNGRTIESDLALRQKTVYEYQFNYAIRNTEFFTKGELLANWKMQHRKVEFSFVTIPAKSFHNEIKLTDQQLKDYYKKNKKRFIVPAAAKFSYIQMDYSNFTKIPSVSNKDISKDYLQYKSNYRSPSTRKASHLLVKVTKKASAKKVAAALKKINEAYAKLAEVQKSRRPGDAPVKVGRLFKKLVKQYSDDKFVAGYVIDPVKQKSLYDALNKVPIGLNSKPVRGDKGFYILYLTKSTAGKIRPLDEVKSLIREKLLGFKARKLYNVKVEQMTALVFENSESLEVASSTLKLKIKTTDWVSKGGKFTGVLQLPKVRTEAFGKDVYASGVIDDSVNSRTINLDNGKPEARSIVIRLKKYRPSSYKAFDQVKAEVQKLLLVEIASNKAKKLGLSFLKELKLSSDIKGISKSSAWIVKKSGLINRFNTKLPKELVQKAFKLGVPLKDKKYISSVQLTNGDYIVFILSKSEYGTMNKVNVQTQKIYQLGNAAMYSEVLLHNTLDLLRVSADVVVKPQLVLKSDNEN